MVDGCPVTILLNLVQGRYKENVHSRYQVLYSQLKFSWIARDETDVMTLWGAPITEAGSIPYDSYYWNNVVRA